MKPRAAQVSINPSGLAIVTTGDVQAALAELDAAVDALTPWTGGTPTAADIVFTPAGTIAATTVQAAIEEAAAEGGGSGSAVTWTKLLVADPMADLTGWTSRSGTWAAGGTYGVQQTNAAVDAWLECDVDLSSYDYRAIEVTVRPVSGERCGVGFADAGSWGGGDFSVWLWESTDKVAYDRYGSGGSDTWASLTLAANTDYVLQIVERVKLQQYIVIVDGVTIGTVSATPTSLGRVGLHCRNGNGWFRDVTVWGGMGPTFVIPT